MADLTGMTLGQYRIVERIGRGGMATVYKAYHASTDRMVAVKVLPEELADDPGFRERFEREAKVVARLQHTNILPVFDYGQEHGISYLVMPYIPGGTLKEYMTQVPHPLEEVARIFSQIALALDYAHRQGIIHRDIKPGNVLLDESGNALLSDFGLTRMAEATSHLTGSMVIGTPAYMSPEQGRGQPLDSRSDIYSMGILLYEMVTGNVPFSADTPVAVIFKHIHDPLPPPRTLRSDLPDAAQNVILKALAKEPEQRYSSCVEMAQAFSQAVTGQPVMVDLPPEYDQSRTTSGAGVKSAVPAKLSDDQTQLLPPARRGISRWAIVPLIVISGLAILLLLQPNPEQSAQIAAIGTETSTPTDTPTDESTATEIPTGTDMATPTDLPTAAPTLTTMPTIDAIAAAQATNEIETTINAVRTQLFYDGQTETAAVWTATPIHTMTPRPTNTPTPTETPRPTNTAIPQQAILFQNDFEDGLAEGFVIGGLWRLIQESTGNHVYQGGAESEQSTFYIGSSAWSNYTVEMRYRLVDFSGLRYDNFAVCVRCNALFSAGYSLGIPPTGDVYWQRNGGGQHIDLVGTHAKVDTNTWNSLRIEVNGQVIRTTINGNAISDVFDSTYSSGGISVLIESGLLIDFDDIRVWSL